MASNWRADPASVIDSFGRIVRSENRIGRAISGAHAEFIKHLVSVAERKNWFEAGLIPTSVSHGDTFENFPLVLEHQHLSLVTERYEWSAVGLQRAALCVLRLSLKLLEDDVCIHDPHTWNVLFDATVPRFIDFTSIQPLERLDHKFWFDCFNHYFVAPLLLFAEGKRELARAFTREHMKGVGLWMLQNNPSMVVLLPQFEEYGRPSLERLYTLIEGLRFEGLGGEWDSYEQPTATDGLRAKDRVVSEILKTLRFDSVIDIGANRGLHSFMCADMGARVIACDIEEGCVNDLFLAAERASANVLPLVLDVVDFAGSRGALHTQKPANERLKSDLVVALALVHHVSFRRRFYPEALLATLSSFTRDCAIVEFVPDDDWHVAQWALPPLENYTLEGFWRILSDHFDHVENIPIEPSPRSIFVCRGKKSGDTSQRTGNKAEGGLLFFDGV